MFRYLFLFFMPNSHPSLWTVRESLWLVPYSPFGVSCLDFVLRYRAWVSLISKRNETTQKEQKMCHRWESNPLSDEFLTYHVFNHV